MESNRLSVFGAAVHATRFGVLPATFFAVLGDFLSPRGLWLVPLAMGLVALLALFLILLFKPVKIKAMALFGAGERQRFWRKPYAAYWALLAFAACGVGLGLLSGDKAEQGGVIASNLQVVSTLQRMTGIAERSLEEQTRTRKGVDDLVEIGQTGAAANPRVTLDNRGVDWTAGNLADALQNSDMETVELFLQGGMSIGRAIPNASELGYHFRNYSPDVAKVLTAHADQIPARACLPDGFGFSGSLRDWLVDEERLALYAKICDKPEVRKKIKENADALRASAQETRQSNATVSQDRRQCIVRLKRDFSIQDAIGLGFPPSINGNSTIDAPEERVAVGVQSLLNRPGLDDATMEREYGDLIERSCEESFAERATPAGDDFYGRVLAAF